MTTPAGSLSLAQEYLRATVAASATFQALVGADSAAEAIERIYHNGLPKPANGQTHTKAELQAYRPYGVVYTTEKQGFSRSVESVSGHFDFAESGQLTLKLVRESPDSAGDDPTAAANLDWTNLIGQIIDEMCDLAGLADYLAFHTISLVEGPYWPQHPKLIETQGLWQGVELLVQW